MVILHIAHLDSLRASGVNAVVPQHVIHQRNYADTALWNVGEPMKFEGVEQQFSVKSLDELPMPYRAPDIAVFHELYRPKFLPIAKALRRRGIPYVVVPHSSLNRAAQKKGMLKKCVANLFLFKPFCAHAVGIQCLSQTEMDERVFGGTPFIATNGISPQTTVKASFRSDGLRFVYIGRLEPYIKGIDILLRAFSSEKALLHKHNCRLDIYGPDSDNGIDLTDRLNQLTEAADADDIITIHPPVFGQDKERVLLDSDIFIQTSRNDGMPMGILEALTYGLPCLVTKGTALETMIAESNAGWGVETNASAVAFAIRQAVEERGKLPEKSRGALRCAEQFRWDKVAKDAVEQYAQLCQKEQ